jgi:prevent-host-death family protein
MRTVNIHEAKTQLSRLVEEAAKGEPFIIAKSGRPLVKVMPLDAPTGAEVRRVGFMSGIAVPNDFDEMGREEIEKRFGRTSR